MHTSTTPCTSHLSRNIVQLHFSLPHTLQDILHVFSLTLLLYLYSLLHHFLTIPCSTVRIIPSILFLLNDILPLNLSHFFPLPHLLYLIPSILFTLLLVLLCCLRLITSTLSHSSHSLHRINYPCTQNEGQVTGIYSAWDDSRPLTSTSTSTSNSAEGIFRNYTHYQSWE